MLTRTDEARITTMTPTGPGYPADPPGRPDGHQPIAAMYGTPRGGIVLRGGAERTGTAGHTRDCANDEGVNQALASAVKDAERIGDLLDELSRGRLWLPLPDDGGPVTDGSAVQLPTVVYLGAEFVPAYTSAERLPAYAGARRDGHTAQAGPGHAGTNGSRGPTAQGGGVPRGTIWTASLRPDGGDDDGQRAVPHVIVPAAELARRLPPGLGIALNPGAEASVPIYPEGVAYLAATEWTSGGARMRVGRPPAEPEVLLREVSAGLRLVPAARQASRAWLSVPGSGEGLVISVTLDDPADPASQEAVISAVEQAAGAVGPKAGFPIDVTFPGEQEPDDVDKWISDHAIPFHLRA